jgi:hypothetical protein
MRLPSSNGKYRHVQRLPRFRRPDLRLGREPFAFSSIRLHPKSFSLFLHTATSIQRPAQRFARSTRPVQTGGHRAFIDYSAFLFSHFVCVVGRPAGAVLLSLHVLLAFLSSVEAGCSSPFILLPSSRPGLHSPIKLLFENRLMLSSVSFLGDDGKADFSPSSNSEGLTKDQGFA